MYPDAASALEGRVVVYDERAVVGQIDVEFDAVAVFDRIAERGERVFGDGLVVVQTAVRDAPRSQ